MAMTFKEKLMSSLMWEVMLYSLVEVQQFEGMYCKKQVASCQLLLLVWLTV
jgi:hypothetical protein